VEAVNFQTPQRGYDERDGFVISFNLNPGAGFDSFSADTAEGETAIIKDGKYFILNGDWRKAYENKSFDECMKIFSENISEISSWSDRP
jgi:hypothetical protein